MPRSGLSASSHEMFEAVSDYAAPPRSLSRWRKDKSLGPLKPVALTGGRGGRGGGGGGLGFGLGNFSGLDCYLMHSDLKMEILRSNRWLGTIPILKRVLAVRLRAALTAL